MKNFNVQRIIFYCNLAVLICGLLFLSIQKASADGFSASEIIQNAKSAMSSNMTYRVVASGNDIIVFQQIVTNGTLVARCEASAQTFKFDYLFYDGGVYQLFSKAHTAIRMSFAENGFSSTLNPLAMVNSNTVELAGINEFGGITCYDVQARLTSDTNLMATLQANVKATIPNLCRYLIDTNTYRLCKMTMFHDKSSYASMNFDNYKQLPPSLPDDFFNIPKDYQIKTARSPAEYVKMAARYLASTPTNIPKGYAVDPETHYIGKVDPKTGAIILLTNSLSSTNVPEQVQKNARGLFLIFFCALNFGLFTVFLTRYRNRTN